MEDGACKAPPQVIRTRWALAAADSASLPKEPDRQYHILTHQTLRASLGKAQERWALASQGMREKELEATDTRSRGHGAQQGGWPLLGFLIP